MSQLKSTIMLAIKLEKKYANHTTDQIEELVDQLILNLDAGIKNVEDSTDSDDDGNYFPSYDNDDDNNNNNNNSNSKKVKLISKKEVNELLSIANHYHAMYTKRHGEGKRGTNALSENRNKKQ